MDDYEMLENIESEITEGMDNYAGGKLQITLTFAEADMLRRIVREAKDEI